MKVSQIIDAFTRFSKRDFSHVTVTAGSVAEEIVYSFLVPAGTVNTGDLLEVYAAFLLTANANTKTFKIYINNANSLAGATLVGQLATNTNSAEVISRWFPVTASNQLECYNGTVSNRSQISPSNGVSADIAVNDLTQAFYIIISGQKAVGGDTLQGRNAQIIITRPNA